MTGSPRLLVTVAGDRIGDALLRLPVVRGLREAFPEHHITWMTSRRPSAYARELRPLLTGILDAVRECTGVGCHWRQLTGNPLPGEHFDIICCTEQRLLPTLALRQVEHGVLISPAAGFRLSDRRPAPGQPWPEAVGERLRLLLSLAAGRPVAPRPALALPAAYRAAAARLLPPGPRYIGLAPGAGGPAKRWPLERFIALAGAVAAEGFVPVFLLGPQESHLAAAVRAACPEALLPEQAPAGAPAPGPLLAMALAGRLAAAVANDAGAGHLLAAGGAPLVSLYGRTSAAKFAPAGGRARVLTARAFGGRGVAAIPVAAVHRAVRELAGGPAGG